MHLKNFVLSEEVFLIKGQRALFMALSRIIRCFLPDLMTVIPTKAIVPGPFQIPLQA